ncbi:MAG: nucleotidyltransferase family protein, partial [Candidatus Hydrogenedentes bacterium]|nr:nucleotidyltransferase family protein [Candidatus Hydrogenedentota bacterium]
MTRPPGSAELAIALSPFIARERKAALPWARLGEPDWHALQGFLANERLLPLVWSELQRHNAAVPAVFAEACKEARTRNTVQAAVRLRGLKRILDTAAEADVPVIAMRTPYLIERLYGGDCGLRHFLDVDLAVLPRDLAPFLSALRGQFGRLDAGRQTREDAVRKAVLGGRIECRCGGVPLDLHWQLTLLYNFQRSGRRARRQEAIWERSGTVEFSWGACRVLSDEDLLVHLAEHMVIQHDLGGRP